MFSEKRDEKKASYRGTGKKKESYPNRREREPRTSTEDAPEPTVLDAGGQRAQVVAPMPDDPIMTVLRIIWD
jgi:hypothetical protein